MRNCVGESLYQRRKPSSANLILNVIIMLFILVFIGELMFNSVYTNIYVKGSSMTPTLTGAPATDEGSVLPGGDYVFVNTQATPGYFDIVVVKTVDSYGFEYDIIKRVVAFGGDAVKMDRGQLYVKYSGDDEYTKIVEDYVLVNEDSEKKSINTFGEHVVEEGCMFLLGDNRDVSEDSRKKGDFPMTSLVGVVPEWSLKHKRGITAFYTFFEFTLGFGKMNGKIYGD